MDTALTIIIAVLGSTGLSALLQFLIARHDNKRNIPGQLLTLEKDTLRTQILLMIMMQPDEVQEILTVSKHYFADLKGDWYLTGVFNKWCMAHEQSPEWFDKHG